MSVSTPSPSPAGGSAPAEHYRSKSLAAWLALLGGTLGLHRFYLHGLRDAWGWLHPLPTAIGFLGVLRMREMGQDDRLAWAMIPLLGLMITVAMAATLWYALTPDEKWDARHNPGRTGPGTAWAPVLAAILAMMIGGIVMTGTIAFGGQKFFEWQFAEQPAAR